VYTPKAVFFGHARRWPRESVEVISSSLRRDSLARGKLYQMRDAGDRVEIVRERTDLDGDDPEKANP